MENVRTNTNTRITSRAMMLNEEISILMDWKIFMKDKVFFFY